MSQFSLVMMVVGLLCLISAFIVPMLGRRGGPAGLTVALSLAARLSWAGCILLAEGLLFAERLAVLSVWVALEVLIHATAPRGHFSARDHVA